MFSHPSVLEEGHIFENIDLICPAGAGWFWKRFVLQVSKRGREDSRSRRDCQECERRDSRERGESKERNEMYKTKVIKVTTLISIPR
jgi:hypothetical protein